MAAFAAASHISKYWHPSEQSTKKINGRSRSRSRKNEAVKEAAEEKGELKERGAHQNLLHHTVRHHVHKNRSTSILYFSHEVFP
jgi:hypothetical protein